MKKIVLSVLAFSFVLAVKAQEIPERKTDDPGMHHRKDREGMRRHHEMAMKELNLTEAQKEQLKKERESFRTQMEAMHKEHKNRIDGILTPEQKDKLEKMKIEGKERREGMMEKRGEDLKARLNLTDEQSAKMKKNREEMMTKMKAIREDKSLTEEKKKEAVKELMKSNKEKLKSILTEEQLNKMKEERKDNPKHRDDHREKKETI